MHRYTTQPQSSYQYRPVSNAVDQGRQQIGSPYLSPYQAYTPYTPKSVSSTQFSPGPKSEYFPLTGSATPPAKEREDHYYRALSRRCSCDCAAVTLCLLIWILMALSIASYIFFSKAKRNEAGWVNGDTVALAFLTGLAFAAVAAILNDTLIDRCWRRIRAQALRGHMEGSHLRAANFQLFDAFKRIVKGKITKRELATLLSYFLLNFGTIAGFPIIQLTVQYERNPETPTLFLTHIQEKWIPVPIIMHIVSVILGLVICGLPPWALLLNKYDESVVRAAYQRYLDRVPLGSAATSDQVADLLDATDNKPREFASLAVDHSPGLQLKKKLRGIITGTLIVLVVPAGVFAFQHFQDTTGVAVSRFVYSYGIEITATGYGFATSYAIWTLGLEGITATPRSDTNYVGTTSGFMLFVKACRQRRPARVWFMYWIFWLHSGVMRLLLFVTTWALSVQNIVPEQQSINETMWRINSLSKWIFWPAVVWAWILLPFILWLLVPFKAPLAAFDGWRLAKIVEGATLGKGQYGIDGPPGQGRAAWGMHTRVFAKERLL